MTDNMLFYLCASGYIIIPIICIVLMIYLKKWWKYVLCTVAMTLAYLYVMMEFIGYRIEQMEPLDPGGAGLAILIFLGVYIFIGVFFSIIGTIVFAIRKRKLNILLEGMRS